MKGHDNKKGWSSNSLGKALMYDRAAEACKDEQTIIHNPITRMQLKAVEKSTLRAPEGEGENSRDDYADAFAVATAGRHEMGRNQISHVIGIARW
jgi:hypothetical protein